MWLSFRKRVWGVDLWEEGGGSLSEGEWIGVYVGCEGKVCYGEVRLRDGEWYGGVKGWEFGKGGLSLWGDYGVLWEC